jgi:hypothetical protein
MFKKIIKRIENTRYQFLITNIERSLLERLECKYSFTTFDFKA